MERKEEIDRKKKKSRISAGRWANCRWINHAGAGLMDELTAIPKGKAEKKIY